MYIYVLPKKSFFTFILKFLCTATLMLMTKKLDLLDLIYLIFCYPEDKCCVSILWTHTFYKKYLNVPSIILDKCFVYIY